MRLFVFLALIASAASTGCASYFKRKECEKTNWYQHGHDVAMSGRRLDADDFVKQCQKVEAKMSFTDMDTGFKAGMGKYCTSDNIYDVGRAGKPFSYEMCDGENMQKMRGRYTEGLRVFCTPASAYRFGTAGGVYQNVCPKNLENDWLSEYRKGRKIYLAAAVVEKEREIQRLDGEISRLESQRTSLSHQQMMYSGRSETRTEQVYNVNTGTYETKTVTGPSADAQARSQQLSSEISNLNYQIQQTRSKQQDIISEVSKMRTEMVTL